MLSASSSLALSARARRGEVACHAADLRRLIERLCDGEDLTEEETQESLDVRVPIDRGPAPRDHANPSLSPSHPQSNNVHPPSWLMIDVI